MNLMQSKGVAANAYTFTSLMTACIGSGDIYRAKKLLQMKNQIYFNSSEREYDKLIDRAELTALHGSYIIGLTKRISDVGFETRAEAGLVQDVEFALEDMTQLGLVPDVATLNAYIQFLCALPEKNRVSKALSFLKSMILTKGSQPDDYTYSILFTAMGRAGLVSEALALYRAYPKSLDAPAINSLLRAFVSGPNPLDSGIVFVMN